MTLLEENLSFKKTPLYDRHLALQGKMVDFGGWSLPIQYTSIMAEHQHTRQKCSIFDVSHLGEIHVKGKDAFSFLQSRITNDLRKCEPYQVIYALLCNEQGFSLDDILIYRGEVDDYYLIVNAANIEKDFKELLRYATKSVQIDNRSDETACIAAQGPDSEKILETLFGFDLKKLAYYTFKQVSFESGPVWISRSGYTGEDGFELFSMVSLAPKLWDRLLNDGKKIGVLPAGLGARNTLRLEAGNPLYGHEMDEQITPLEAGLGFAVSFEKGDFVGREPLFRQKQAGLQKKLVGFKMKDKSIPRDGYLLRKGGQVIGKVTSGSFAPTLGQGIGMGLVSIGNEKIGTEIEVEVHGRTAPAEVVKRPFVPLKHKKI